MNYSDFGVTCAEELEQDEWSLIGKTFETPKGGVLTVVGCCQRTNIAQRHTSLNAACVRQTLSFLGTAFLKSSEPPWGKRHHADARRRFSGSLSNTTLL